MNKRSRRKNIRSIRSNRSNRSNRSRTSKKSNRSKKSRKSRKKSMRLSKRNNRHSKSKSRNRRKRRSRSKNILKGGDGYIMIKKDDKDFGERGAHKHDDCDHKRCLMIDTDSGMKKYNLDDYKNPINVDGNPITPSNPGALDKLNVTQIKQLATQMNPSN